MSSAVEDQKHGEKLRMAIAKLNFVRNGAIKLPPGFRFQPTDQEIVFEYLIRKIFSCPLPASIVPEIINICKFNPWDLPGDWEQERYFFSKKEAKRGYANRASSNGYWKTTGSDKQIIRCCNNPRKREMITGMKKTLVFYKGKPIHGSRTNWIMHEYRLVHSPTSSSTINSNDQKSWIQMGNWVLCQVLLNKRSKSRAAGKRLSAQIDECMRKDIDEICVVEDEASSSCGSSDVIHDISSP